jgi:hypothetical protein
MLTALALCSALAAPPVMQPIVPDGPVYLAQAGTDNPALPAETPTIEDAGGLVSLLIKAFQDKDWRLVVALIILLVVALGNFVLFKLDVLPPETRKAALPWIAVAIGTLVPFATALIAGKDWLTAGAAALSGFGVALSAIGGWELLLKPIVARLKAKSESKP